ncbi:MAG: hypothetical protein PXZ08_09880 [Actinomycetota bacterium]|nr:hypothetical protein [Actinomycetota bacterium]
MGAKWCILDSQELGASERPRRSVMAVFTMWCRELLATWLVVTPIGVTWLMNVENCVMHRVDTRLPLSRQLAVRRRLVAITVVVASLLGSSSLADAATRTVSAGGLTATFTYQGSLPLPRYLHLTLSQNGQVFYDRPVHSKWCGENCAPNLIAPASTLLHLVRLQQHGPLSVVLDLYSGGAHCCTIEQAFTFSFQSNARRVHMVEHNFGDPSVNLARIGPRGTYDFVSADDRFAYEFTDYAASGLPIEILSVAHNSFRNVTRSFPQLIARDAAQWMSDFKAQASSHYQDTVGLVAAWAADEDLLGHSVAVSNFLATQARAGHLNSALSPINPSGQKFVAALQRFLRKAGYVG